MAMKTKRHSIDEIAAKLQQARAWEAEGKSQLEIAKGLGVSVMTYHRWRKRSSSFISAPRSTGSVSGSEHVTDLEQIERIKELQLENNRLRRLVTDLLLEKMKLEEALSDGKVAS
jgi:putative transposase